MNRLELTYVGEAYPDRVGALEDASSERRDLRVTVVHRDAPGTFRDALEGARFDCFEMSLSYLSILASLDDDRFIALPVFPLRLFVHRDIWVARDSLFTKVADLAGCRIGLPHVQSTQSTWVRDLLAREGLPNDAVTWVQAPLRAGGSPPTVVGSLPESLTVETAADGSNLTAMLTAGDIDGIVVPTDLTVLSDAFRRLLPDYESSERKYYDETRIYPIVHAVAVRREIVEQYPWVGSSLVAVFQRSREIALERYRTRLGSWISHPWWLAELERLFLTFGGDPYEAGLTDLNRRTVDEFLRLSADQGISRRRLQSDDLFQLEVP